MSLTPMEHRVLGAALAIEVRNRRAGYPSRYWSSTVLQAELSPEDPTSVILRGQILPALSRLIEQRLVRRVPRGYQLA